MATVSTAAASADLSGAGSTLVAPLMANWINGFEARTEVKVTYGAVGSGTGIKNIIARTVDFGASDAPMTPEQTAECNGCVQVPWGLSAVGIGYNVPGVKKLNLTGPILAGIYLGNITKWNDPKIKKINPKAHLPNLAITPVHRSDGSGDTYAFANYLSKVSPTWAKSVGVGTTLGFPVGIGAAKNAGVKNVVLSTKGGIGYISASYLLAAGLGAAAIQNQAGNFEFPNLSNISAAAEVVKHIPPSNAISIVNPPKRAKTAYPLSTFTYAIVPQNSKNLEQMVGFLKYAIGTGQKYGPALDFAPLPKVIINAAKHAISTL
jgi:phosphate transport system substrate-binding protein